MTCSFHCTRVVYMQRSIKCRLLAGLGSRAIVEHIWNCVKYLMPNSISACLESNILLPNVQALHYFI